MDVFREQRDVADRLHGQLVEISALLGRLRQQVNALALNEDLRTVLREEHDWLTRAQLAVSEVRSFREGHAAMWPGVFRRWVAALVFALVSAAAAGAGYAWWTRPYVAELNALRLRIEFASFVEHRVLTMTPSQRGQLEKLMN